MPGTFIFKEGDPAREMYVVLDGEMEILKKSRRGRETRISILGPNDTFGEMSIIDMQPRSATVRALGATRLLKISTEEMDALYRHDLKSYTLIVLNIARDLSRRLRVTDGLLADFTATALEEYVTDAVYEALAPEGRRSAVGARVVGVGICRSRAGVGVAVVRGAGIRAESLGVFGLSKPPPLLLLSPPAAPVVGDAAALLVVTVVARGQRLRVQGHTLRRARPSQQPHERERTAAVSSVRTRRQQARGPWGSRRRRKSRWRSLHWPWACTARVASPVFWLPGPDRDRPAGGAAGSAMPLPSSVPVDSVAQATARGR